MNSLVTSADVKLFEKKSPKVLHLAPLTYIHVTVGKDKPLALVFVRRLSLDKGQVFRSGKLV